MWWQYLVTSKSVHTSRPKAWVSRCMHRHTHTLLGTNMLTKSSFLNKKPTFSIISRSDLAFLFWGSSCRTFSKSDLASLNFFIPSLAEARLRYAFVYKGSKVKATEQSSSAAPNLQDKEVLYFKWLYYSLFNCRI